MKQIGIIRHAKSAWGNDVPRDHDRYLADRGKKQASELSTIFHEIGFIPEMVYVSSAKRTQETWEIVKQNHCLHEVFTKIEEELYLASTTDVYKVLSQTPNEVSKVIIVGHNPTVSAFAQEILDNETLNFKTCNYLGISIPSEDWKLRYQKGEQTFFWQPSV